MTYYGERLRNVRVADDLWADARMVAAARGDTLSGVIRDALTRYVGRNREVLAKAKAAEKRKRKRSTTG